MDDNQANEEPADGDAVETSIVQVDDGLALVVGRMPEGWVGLPDTFLGKRENAVLNTMIESVGVANLGIQAVNAWQQSAHLVRLSPQTLTALKSGAPIVKDGWNLGTVMANGKFVHQVRWLPATGASVASVAASAGTALALIAIQAQIAAVADVARETLDTARETLQELRTERWSQTRALFEVMAGGVREATTIGGCSDGVWANVAGRDFEIRKARHEHLDTLTLRLAELEGTTKAVDRLKWMERNGAATLHDAELLLMSNQAWLMYSALRVSHLMQDEERNRDLIDDIITAVREQHSQGIRTAVQVIDRVYAALDVLADQPGKALLPVGKARRSAKEVRRLAIAHRDALERSAISPIAGLVPVPELPDVAVGERPESAFERTRRRLRWVLVEGEVLEAVAVARRADAKKIVALTSSRLLVIHAEGLIERGDITWMLDVPVDQIRYVRLADWGKKGGLLRLTCRDEDIDLVFERGASPALDALVALLRTKMVLPVEETGRVLEIG